MRNARRINNLLKGAYIAKKAEAVLLFTPTVNKKKKKFFNPFKTN